MGRKRVAQAGRTAHTIGAYLVVPARGESGRKSGLGGVKEQEWLREILPPPSPALLLLHTRRGRISSDHPRSVLLRPTNTRLRAKMAMAIQNTLTATEGIAP